MSKLFWYLDDVGWRAYKDPKSNDQIYEIVHDITKYGLYYTDENTGGFLSKDLIIEQGVGTFSAVGLKPSCAFETIEAAKEAAEKHYKLLILQ